MVNIHQFAAENNIGEERVRQLCKAGKVPGAKKIGEGRRGVWIIPAGAKIVRKPHGRPFIVDAEQYPQLLAVMWDRKTKVIEAKDAFMLYERNSKWIDLDAMERHEKVLFNRLVKKYGEGHFNG